MPHDILGLNVLTMVRYMANIVDPVMYNMTTRGRRDLIGSLCLKDQNRVIPNRKWEMNRTRTTVVTMIVAIMKLVELSRNLTMVDMTSKSSQYQGVKVY
jgi:hypothetical protein